MEFKECLMVCASNRDFVSHYDRLTRSNLSLKGSALDILIDSQTGRQEAEVADFINFVYENVWQRIPGE